ncbi:MAG: hypothetical protein ABS95_02680 [Verrucomicrobia bacterium SCN 57-15]|nr:MAG: hypothetical protein ABS95_02680 [Verrucomicrobia bacterium SCN 57-15]
MKQFKAYATAVIALLVAALFAGCAHVHSQSKPTARSAARLNARGLDDPALKQFLEQRLNHSLETWPLESWDFPTLTLVAFYFHPDLDSLPAEKREAEPWKNRQTYLPNSTTLQERTAAWEVRRNLRTNLLAYVAAQRRQELLRNLESTQMELAQVVEKRLAADAVPPVELSLLRIQLAETRLELIETFQKRMNFRERVADAVGLPVKAFLEIEVTYDFSMPSGYGQSTRELRQRALRSRSDILLALTDYTAAETTLRAEIARKHPSARFHPGCTWDADNNRWAVNLNADLRADSGRSRIAEAEARRVKAAAHMLDLQSRIIDELDRSTVAYRARLEDAADIDRLATAIRQQHDRVAALFKTGAAIRLELLMARLQLMPAEIAKLDAQEKLHEALGALEDTVQLPAALIDPSAGIVPERPLPGRQSL